MPSQCRVVLDVTVSTSRNVTHSLRCDGEEGHLDDHHTASGSTWREHLARPGGDPFNDNEWLAAVCGDYPAPCNHDPAHVEPE